MASAVWQLPVPAAGGPVRPGAIPTALTAFEQHIKHIVVVMLENHAFDNYFGTYCGAVGPYCPSTVDGIPAGTCVPYNPANVSLGCITPYNDTKANWSISQPMLHGYAPSHQAWNNGSMNGFYLAEHSGTTPFGHFNGSTIPLYWDLAEQYGLGDHFFSTAQAYSLPNHWDLVAGQAPAEILKNALGNSTPGAPPATVRSLYLAQANNTSSVEDLLKNTTTSWDYYDYALGNWTVQSNVTTKVGGAPSDNAFDYWNPQAAKQESYAPSVRGHFVPGTSFFGAASSGRLPTLSWLIPYAKQSDHPPNSVPAAEAWVASVVDAVESSPEWNTTALFITYDEYGGFYDHLAPPVVNGVQLSFRVPLLVISPYTQPGTVVSQNLSFFSLLHLMEDRGRLGCLVTSDCQASLPLQFFNFTAGPRPPLIFSTNRTTWIYPQTVQRTNAAYASVRFTADPQFTDDPEGNGVDVD